VLDEQAAAVCVVLIDQAMPREDNPVRQPNGYFRSMLRKAERGELHLHESVFGILKRGGGQSDVRAQGHRSVLCMGGVGG
jgi:replication initiation protein RepC